MLTHLSVTNFAIINNVSIDFDDHFTVLTGETGAGKSLIIDAIGLLLGDRAQTSMIRTGCDKATIEGTFENYNENIDNLLKEIGIEPDDFLIIRREILANGKSVCRINGYIVTLNQLVGISSMLADIHTQLDTKKLFDLRNYVDFIEDDSSRALLKIYLDNRAEYLNHLKDYKKLLNEFEDSKDNLDYYQYRLSEIKSLNLRVGEEEELQNELYSLNNFDNIYNSLKEAISLFKDQDITNSLYLIKQLLAKLSQMDDRYSELTENINSIYYDLDDAEETLKSNFNHLEYNPKRLDDINIRLSTLKEAQRKYRMSIEQLIDYQAELENLISNVDQSDFILNEKKKILVESFNNLLVVAKNLSEIRKNNAIILTNSIKDTLKDLYLDKVSLLINVSSNEINDPLDNSSFLDTGIDNVEFLISFNVGEALKPLNKVASGGEMSRVMLALKTHLLSNMHLSTIIFDEIDTGISGEVALAVAYKLKDISRTTQVLAITHLPIVAASGDQHFVVTKEVKDDKTFTRVIKLNKEERIEYISGMISSNKDEISSQIVSSNMIKQFEINKK